MKHVVFIDSTVSGLLAFEAAKRLGCRVTFVLPRDASFLAISGHEDRHSLAPYLRYVDDYVELDNLTEAVLGECLDRLHRERPIDAVLSTSEAAIVSVAREAQRLGLVYPDHRALCDAVYKDRLRAVLRQHGLRSPDFEVLSEDELVTGRRPRIALPFVVKPVRGFAKQFSAVCKHAADFDRFLHQLRQARAGADPMIDQLVSRDYLIEQYVEGSLHSAEVIAQGGVVSCYATTVRFRAVYDEILEMTSTMPSGLDAAQCAQIKAYVQAVFQALRLDVGLFHVELLLDQQGPCLVEINARMMGSVAPQMYCLLTGIDPFELLVRLHLGEPLVINESALTHAGCVVTIASRFGGQIADTYDPNAFLALLDRYAIRFCTAHVFPGQAVNRYIGNIGTIGHVIVEDDCPFVAAAKGNRFLRELSLLYGIELATYQAPALP